VFFERTLGHVHDGKLEIGKLDRMRFITGSDEMIARPVASKTGTPKR